MVKSYFLLYLDANNLYGYTISKSLPYDNFEWVSEKERSEINKNICSFVRKLENDDSTGYIFEVDIEYPNELHDFHNDLPFCAESMIPPIGKFPKLIANLMKKNNT